MRKRLLSNIGAYPFSCLFDLTASRRSSIQGRAFAHKKSPRKAIFRGLFLRSAPLEDLNVFQHTSPERLVRVMVMMMVELNACHRNLKFG